jgi:hypothetical protein
MRRRCQRSNIILLESKCARILFAYRDDSLTRVVIHSLQFTMHSRGLSSLLFCVDP